MKYFYAGSTPDVERAAFEAVRQGLAAEFGEPVKELALPDIEFAFDAGRRQYRSMDVLERLSAEAPVDAWKLVAVTERDLFVPVLTFVFGQAQLAGTVAVISLARLRQEFYGMAPNREVLLERAVKEALHEAGHLSGLVHCADRACVMSLATNVRQIDGRRAAWCSACAAHVRHAVGVKR